MTIKNRIHISRMRPLLLLDFEESNKLLEILSEILNENEELKKLKNSISFDKISSTGNIIPHQKIHFSDSECDEEEYNIIGFSDVDSGNYSIVRFSDFTPKHILGKTIFGKNLNRNGHRRTSSHKFWIPIYKSSPVSETSLRYGVNVCRKIKASGSLLNFTKMKTLFNHINNGDLSEVSPMTELIHDFYYVSDKNILLGVSTVNGELFIRLQAVRNMLKNNEKEEIKKCLLNLFMCYNDVLDQYESANIRAFEKRTTDILSNTIISNISKGEISNRRFFRYNSNDVSEEDFKAHIKTHISSVFNELTNDTIFGSSDQYSYSHLLNKLLKTRKDHEENIFKDGFDFGLKIGIKLETLGWRSDQPDFINSDNKNNIWWTKDVNIIPDTFISSGRRYIIPKEDREYKISKLHINQRGELYATSDFGREHPNVNNHRVCMGDLSINLSDDLDDIEKTLIASERLLDMINFDSSYRSCDKEYLLGVSVLDKVLNKENGLSITANTNSDSTIKKIDDLFESDEDDEDETEEVDQIIQNFRCATLFDNQGNKIMVDYCPASMMVDTDEEPEGHISNHFYYGYDFNFGFFEKDIKTVELIESDEDLIIIDNISKDQIQKELNIVLSSGKLQPLVKKNINRDNLVLTDQNLMREKYEH